MGIQKPNLSAIWADQGAIIAPTDAKVRLGWVAEVPPNQWENWVQNRQDRALAYLMQKGLPEWDAETEYVANKSFVQRDGNIYKCIVTNTGNDPSTSPTFWDKSIGLGLGTAAFSNVTTSISDSTVGRLLKVGDFGLGSVMANLRGTTSPLSGFGAYYDGETEEGGGTFFINVPYTSTIAGFRISNLPYQNRFYLHAANSTAATFQPPVEVLHTGNFNPSLKADKSVSISAGAGLSGGGDLSQNRSFSVVYGTTANTSAQGNDTRIVNSLQKNNNLSDLNNVSVARTNLGLGNNDTGRANLGLGSSSTLDVGTTAGTVAAGNDSRIVGAAQKSANLSDLTNISSARNNLGLGTAAIANVLGPVSSGAIIERGNNANGQYIKYADGTLWCIIRANRPVPTTGLNGVWISAQLPAAFRSSSGAVASFEVTPSDHHEFRVVGTSVTEVSVERRIIQDGPAQSMIIMAMATGQY